MDRLQYQKVSIWEREIERDRMERERNGKEGKVMVAQSSGKVGRGEWEAGKKWGKVYNDIAHLLGHHHHHDFMILYICLFNENEYHTWHYYDYYTLMASFHKPAQKFTCTANIIYYLVFYRCSTSRSSESEFYYIPIDIIKRHSCISWTNNFYETSPTFYCHDGVTYDFFFLFTCWALIYYACI